MPKTKIFLMIKFAMEDLGGVSLISRMQVSRDRLEGTLDNDQGTMSTQFCSDTVWSPKQQLEHQALETTWT